MFKKSSICFIALLSLLIDPVTVSAVDTPPEYKFYFPIVSRLYRPGMVYVPEGPFLMGCDPEHSGGYECRWNAVELRTVSLDAFYIDKFEVTIAQFKQCVEDGGCTQAYYNAKYQDPNYANHPFLGGWEDGIPYCLWAEKRPPTYEEWEKAARGTNGRSYPWGEAAPICGLANFQDCVGDTVEVGSYPDGTSPYGALDMAGNAYEWVYTDLPENPSSPGLPGRLSPWSYLMKGGYYQDSASFLLASNFSSSPGLGAIRCVADEP